MEKASYIRPAEFHREICPVFRKKFSVRGEIKKAVLYASARGIYEASLNGQKVGDQLFTPGWTSYRHRFQYQKYDVTQMIKEENDLQLLLAKGWYLGRVAFPDGADWDMSDNAECAADDAAVIAELVIEYSDGHKDTIFTDTSWQTAESPLRFCDFYDGEIYDATIQPQFSQNAVISKNNQTDKLVPEQGEKITEHEHIKPINVIITPKGETVLDFGQNITGYIEFTVCAKKYDTVSFSFAEILDSNGNFYNANYRTAKCLYKYVCRDGEQTHKPPLTFYGFRYVRIDEFPAEIDPQLFTAIAVYSDIKQTGHIECSNNMINRLFSNIIWGQKDNYLDVPTDCPQRDERQGWTGDAQVFVRAASYNFDIRRFFKKWLTDMKLLQNEDGSVPILLPNPEKLNPAAGWSDAVTICPWELYMTYGDKEFLSMMFESMKKWVDYITRTTKDKGLWTGAAQFGDWLELNAEYGEFKGKTRDDLIASAYYAKSTQIVCKTGKILNEDVSKYEELYREITETYKKTFTELKTQTEYAITIHFDLTDDKKRLAAELADMIHRDGDMLQTGFVGTPYILHALSQNGYHELAYTLLLREEYPSWIYPITKGATTMWEHWDGIMPDGRLWPDKMNSFNHYAYGAVADWLYSVAAGINPVETQPGFEFIHFAPIADSRLEYFSAELETRFGLIRSGWKNIAGKTLYEITTPSEAVALINGKEYTLKPGNYTLE